jgi:hypothetical protein
VNGKKVAASQNRQKPAELDLAPHFHPGLNTVAVEVINWPDPESGKGSDQAAKEQSAGFIFFAAGFDMHGGDNDRPDVAGHGRSLFQLPAWTHASDAAWLCSRQHVEGWENPDFDTDGWSHAVDLGPISAGPWKLHGALTASLRRQVPSGQVRSSLFNEDPLTRALGRPNREQVVTRRDSIATTLQALELSNGTTLDDILKHGADYWLERKLPATDLARQIFSVTLGREPTGSELEASLGLLGAPASPDGVADLLWAIIMLPEFQMVY